MTADAPPSLAITLGVGCSTGCDPAEMATLVGSALSALPPGALLHSLSTIDTRADEPAIRLLARSLSLPLRLFSAEDLEAQSHRIANPSARVFAATGCHGVAESAALAQAGAGGLLLVERQKSRRATCAIAALDPALAGQPPLGRDAGP